MALAHIRNGQIIRRYGESRGWVKLENGSAASPPVAGFVSGNDKIVEIVEEVTDTSTGPDVIRLRTETVEADRVLVATSIRDMTAQEITSRDEVNKDSEAGSVQDVLIKVITNHENRIRALESLPAVTEAQVRTFLRGLL